MNEYHRPKVQGSCKFIEDLEKEIKKIHGIVILHDGGKRFKEGEDLFNLKTHRSPTFQRTYLIPIGYQGIRLMLLRVKVFYDYRDKKATLEASNPDKFEGLFERKPELQKAIKETLTHYNGHKLVDVRELSENRAELIITCPRCKERIKHGCSGDKEN